MHKRNKHNVAREAAIKKARQAERKLKSLSDSNKPTISKKELDNCHTFDLELVFNKKSPSYPKRQVEMRRFVNALTKKTYPKNLRSPITSGIKREKQSWRNIETLLANIYKMRTREKSKISISLSVNTYSYRRVNSGIINLVKLAIHFGLFDFWIGFRNQFYHRESRFTRIQPTPKFYKLLAKKVDTEDVIYEPDDLIEIRRNVIKTVTYKKNGRIRTRQIRKKEIIPRRIYEQGITNEKAAELNKIRQVTQWFNLVLGDYRITYTDSNGKEQILKINLKSIFTDDFERGGRFYTRGDGHQQLPKEVRQTIRIERHSTKELDYGGQHIRMLHHFKGIHYPLKKDPYAAVLMAMGKKPKRIKAQFGQDFYELIHDDLKVMLLALVNGKFYSKDPIKTATRRANWRLFRAYEKMKNPDTRLQKQIECDERKERWQKASLLNRNGSTFEVLKAFHKAHKHIKDNFSSGCGLKLQNIDAEIAFYVMMEMMVSEKDRCVPTLPIHDSFITFNKSKYLKKLRRAMKMVYRIVMQRKTGRKENFKIPIKG